MYCSTDDNTWCKYHEDKMNITNLYDRTKCLPFVFRGEVKDIFTRLSSPNILKSCARGLTQNQNESINNMIWSKCSKRIICSKNRFNISVYESIIKWNEGALGRKMLLQFLNVTCGPNIVAGLRIRQQSKKIKNAISYIPGAFSTKITPDIDCTSNGQIPTIQKQVDIVFIDDNNVVDFIKDYYFQ